LSPLVRARMALEAPPLSPPMSPRAELSRTDHGDEEAPGVGKFGFFVIFVVARPARS
jgi:hypothetical protein